MLLDGADGNLVRRVTVLRSGARGIQLQNGSDDTRLEFDVSSDNGRSGMRSPSQRRNRLGGVLGVGERVGARVCARC